jgi:dCMP deaminase
MVGILLNRERKEKMDENLTVPVIWKWQTENRRPTWDEYFLMMAQIVSTRSTCDRGPNQKFRQHKGTGCVIVSPDKKHISTGYVGAPPGQPHCDEVGHLMVDGHCVLTEHAESNAIINATFSLKGSTLYTTTFPCYHCVRRICMVEIKRVCFTNPYRDYAEDKESMKLFTRADIVLERFEI